MSDLLRTFIAAPIEATPVLRDWVTRLQAFEGSVRCTNLDQLHVTLKFLSATPADRVPAILKSLALCAESERASPIRIQSLGTFPGPGQPRVLWAGLRSVEPLVRLASDLESRIAAIGFPPEGRPFVPHLTLARLTGPPPVPLRRLIETSRDADFGEVRLDRVVLFRSDLGHSGPTYVPLGSCPLAS